MVKNDDKREVLNYIQEMENRWKEEKQVLLNDKRKLLKEVRELKKEIEILKNTNELQSQMKDNQLNLIKEMVGGKVKDWDSMYDRIEFEKNALEAKVEKLEGNLNLSVRDGNSRLDQLQREKENIIRELNIEHEKAIDRQKDKIEKIKQDEIKKEIQNIRSKIEKETEEIIENQRKLWEEELRLKEEEIVKQQQKWQNEFENQRVDLEKREKAYLEDLLDKFKKS
jgi:hypothetical protein